MQDLQGEGGKGACILVDQMGSVEHVERAVSAGEVLSLQMKALENIWNKLC